MAVNLQENPLYFRMFQVLMTLCLNMKVDLSPKTMIQTQYHLLDGENQRYKALSYPSLLAFRLQPRLNLKEILKANSAFYNSTRFKTVLIFFICCINLLVVLQFFCLFILHPFAKQAGSASTQYM